MLKENNPSNPHHAESAEIPCDYLVVIADDEIEKGEATLRAAQSAMQQNGTSGAHVHRATNVEDLFSRALYGKAGGKQADAVCLDDLYATDEQEWTPTPEMMSNVAKRRSIDFSPYTPQHGETKKMMGIMPDALYHPNSIHLALLLRITGYTGQIFIVSSTPPDVDKILQDTEALAEAVQQYSAGFPINGCTMKKGFFGEITYANEIMNDRWEYSKTRGGLDTSLKILLGQ